MDEQLLERIKNLGTYTFLQEGISQRKKNETWVLQEENVTYTLSIEYFYVYPADNHQACLLAQEPLINLTHDALQ